jgi:hypothetical protein
MKARYITAALLSLSCVFYSASAQSDDADFLAKLEGTFETNSPVPAKDFVPAELMSGRLHTVRPLADNDGLRNFYFLETPRGVDEVSGTFALITHIRELYALDYLRGLSKSNEFGKALAKSAGAKLDSAGDVLRNPISTIKSVPKGASRFLAALVRVSKEVRARVKELECR